MQNSHTPNLKFQVVLEIMAEKKLAVPVAKDTNVYLNTFRN
mgnify:CR=1 FL=1